MIDEHVRPYEATCPVCEKRGYWVIPPDDTISRCPNPDCDYLAPVGREEDVVYVDAQRPCPFCHHAGPHHENMVGFRYLREPVVHCAGCALCFTDRPPMPVTPTGIEYNDAVQHILGGAMYERWTLDIGFEAFSARERLVRKYAWAIPNPAAIAALAALSPLVEMGAGTGYWAHEITRAGGKVMPYDAYPPDGTPWPRDENGNLARFTDDGERQAHPINWYHRDADAWTKVWPGRPPMLREYGNPWTLLLSWPPYDDPMGMEAVGHFRGDRIALIAEGQGGATGNSHMWRLLDRFWTAVDEIDLPQWPGMHDYLTIYVRKRLARRQLPMVAGT